MNAVQEQLTAGVIQSAVAEFGPLVVVVETRVPFGKEVDPEKSEGEGRVTLAVIANKNWFAPTVIGSVATPPCTAAPVTNPVVKLVPNHAAPEKTKNLALLANVTAIVLDPVPACAAVRLAL